MIITLFSLKYPIKHTPAGTKIRIPVPHFRQLIPRVTPLVLLRTRGRGLLDEEVMRLLSAARTSLLTSLILLRLGRIGLDIFIREAALPFPLARNLRPHMRRQV